MPLKTWLRTRATAAGLHGPMINAGWTARLLAAAVVLATPGCGSDNADASCDLGTPGCACIESVCSGGASCVDGVCVVACGDGVVGDAEVCDDGNTVDGDYCSADCLTVTGGCGDGIVQSNEACDIGAVEINAYCAPDCLTITGSCGDGIQQYGEACDDGNTVDGDYCSPDCLTSTGSCGDGILQSNETCDDGNAFDGDYCSGDCLTSFGACGDGIVQPFEACDDGNLNFGDYCAGDCQSITGSCGDGNTQNNEACDDGNTDGDDYCAPDCQTVTGACGDDTLQPNEACDDGNATDGDYCSADCQTVTGSCGDGTTQTNEACDDGNASDGDYCSADCQTVTGNCGDGTQQTNETCDDGNTDVEACAYGLIACQVCGPDCALVNGAVSYCGDNVLDTSNAEVCDDGNASDGDYCSATCQSVTGSCGDNVVQSNETCDDGNTITDACAYGVLSCDVCGSGCATQPGVTSYCGDDLVDFINGEVCDDGNNTDGDYCANDCLTTIGSCGDGVLQTNEACDDGADNGNGTSTCAPTCQLNVCGDGYTGPGEVCDDGDTTEGGDCSADCQTVLNVCGDGVVTGSDLCDVGPSGTCNVCLVSDTGPDGSYGFRGLAEGDSSGYTVASAGDVDGDGLDDILIGARGDDQGGDDVGASYLLLAADILALAPNSNWTLSAAISYTFIGEADGDQSGLALASAGDVDGDGLDDILIGTPRNDEGGTNAGKSYLFLGADILDSPLGSNLSLADASYSLVGEASDSSGVSVDSAGDVDGDGLDDLLIGADNSVQGAVQTGAAYVVFASDLLALPTGTAFNLALAPYVLVGEGSGDRAGHSVASAGDVDGDGRDDLLVGAYQFDLADPGDGGGKSYLVLAADLLAQPPNTSFSLATASYALVGETVFDDSGVSVASAGDVDGDGRDDLVIGAPENDSGGPANGSAYLLLAADLMALPSGTVLSPADASYTLLGEAGADDCGISVASAGDFDGDGLDDLLIGAHLHDQVDTNNGKSYVVLAADLLASPLGTSLNVAQASYALVGAASGEISGRSVASAGDVNGDGRADLLIGAPNNDGGGGVNDNRGKSYLIFSHL